MNPHKKLSNFHKLWYLVGAVGFALLIGSYWGGNILFAVGFLLLTIAMIISPI